MPWYALFLIHFSKVKGKNLFTVNNIIFSKQNLPYRNTKSFRSFLVTDNHRGYVINKIFYNHFKILIMIRKTIALAIAACTLLACKNNDPEVKPEVKETYFPLAIGNQWVYDTYAVSYQDKETLMPELRDTVTITKDTLIDGKSYFLLRSSFKISNLNEMNEHQFFSNISNTALRDSSGYILGPYGAIRCSPDFESHDTLKTRVDQYLTYKYVMKDPNKDLTVPAGTFKVVAMEKNVQENKTNNKKIVNEYFVKNVGPIYNHVIFMHEGKDLRRKKLVAYHLK